MSIAINETNFPDASFRQYVSENFDTDNDGILNDTEIENAKEINIGSHSDYKNLSSIAGIDYLTSIEGIWLMYCASITSASISACQNLKHAVFEQCSNLATLSLTNCSDLEEINISGTKLSAFDVSNYAKLKKLNIANTSISAISIRPDAPLERLLVNETSIASLVLGQRQYLTELQFFSTGISNVDISGCPALKVLICYDTSLPSLNITNCEYLLNVLYSATPVKSKRNNKDTVVYYSTETRYQLWADESVSIIDGTNIRITSQPEDASVILNNDAEFNVVAVGENLTYRWERRAGENGDWTIIDNADSSNYSFLPTLSDDDTYYRCLITNDEAAVYTHVAKLKILTAPRITKQPSSVTVYSGKEATFSIKAEGVDISYQWLYAPSENTPDIYWSPIGDAESDTLSLIATQSINEYWYRCRVTNDIGSVLSDPAQLNVEIDQRVSLPVITTQPSSVSITENETATFSIAATGQDLAYQWVLVLDDGSIEQLANIQGETNSTYSMTASMQLNGTRYCCIVTNPAGSVISNSATLTVNKGSSISVPIIKSQPRSVTASIGSSVNFRTLADGGNLSYQWQTKTGNAWYDIPGETNNIYSFVAHAYDNQKEYRCRVSNPAGSVITTIASLTISESSPVPMYGYHSIIISGKNTYGEWEMYPTSRPHVAQPEVKTSYVDIPGADGGLDYTELLNGKPNFGFRKGSWEFLLIPQEKWPKVYKSLVDYLHGREHTIVLEDDPNLQYKGRLAVNEWRSAAHNSLITIDYILDPFPVDISGEEYDEDEENLNAAARVLRKPGNQDKVIALWNGEAVIMPISEYFEDGDDISY